MKTVLTTSNVRIFEAVARLHSVSRAAEELETSQPYISKQIASMETQCNVQLFSRVGRRLYLTPTGEMLQQYAEQVMESLKRAEEMLSQSAALRGERLRIATTTTGMYMLPEWLAGFGDRAGEFETAVVVAGGEEVERQVISGEADLGFVAKRPRSRSVVVNVLAEDSLVLAMERSHPLVNRSSVRLDDLDKERFIVREPQSATRALSQKVVFQKHPDWRFHLQINHIDAVKSSLVDGIGISFISQRAIARELKSGTLATVPVAGLDLRRPICMLSNAHGVMSKAANGLAKFIAAVL
jgi:DNA-binding transcriptional LysR family regulator